MLKITAMYPKKNPKPQMEKLRPWKKLRIRVQNEEKEAIKIGINFNTVKLPNLFGSFDVIRQRISMCFAKLTN